MSNQETTCEINAVLQYDSDHNRTFIKSINDFPCLLQWNKELINTLENCNDYDVNSLNMYVTLTIDKMNKK